jgi:hypothetical protein
MLVILHRPGDRQVRLMLDDADGANRLESEDTDGKVAQVSRIALLDDDVVRRAVVESGASHGRRHAPHEGIGVDGDVIARAVG